jgi:signal transduction histidine kinase
LNLTWTALAEALTARSQQIHMRALMALGIAAALGVQLGWRLTLGWLAVWSLLQASEYLGATRLSRRPGWADRRWPALGLTLIALSNVAFGAVAVAAVASGDAWTMMCGMCVLAGTVLNAGPASRTSGAAFLASVGPTAVWCATLVWLALRAGASAPEVGGLAASLLLLLAAGLMIRRFGVSALETERAANAAKSVFVAQFSHEIRTPLNGVLGMAQALEGEALAPDQRAKVATIRTSGEALLAILNDLLDLAKIEANRLEIVEGAFPLEALVEEVVGTFSALAAAKALALRADLGAAAGTYHGDPVRLRQILQNLVSNAVKFTDAGAVTVSAAYDGSRLRLEVTDTGVGLAPAAAAKVFQAFHQANPGGLRPAGTGLGLAICRALARAMGGDITLRSAPGQGSTFSLDLPLRRLADASPPASGDAAPAAPALPPLRVLAAEDNPTNQLVLRALLAPLGVEPTVVGDGAAAVDAWSRAAWDLILMDVQMPVMDGVAAARAIREAERRSGRTPTVILALSANAMRHQVAEYLAAGMDGHIAKPIEVQALAAALQAAAAPAAEPRRRAGP